MTDIFAYIKHYLSVLGFEHFTVQPFEIIMDNVTHVTTHTIEADNEFYFLMSNHLEVGTIIECDTNYFKFKSSNNDYRNSHFAQVFTKKIVITVPSTPNNQLIEFLRVIPIKKVV